MVKKKWIQKVGIKRGALSNQLGILEKDNIPVSLIEMIVSAKIGDVVINPSKKGKKKIKVTRLLKLRTVLAKNLKRIKK